MWIYGTFIPLVEIHKTHVHGIDVSLSPGTQVQVPPDSAVFSSGWVLQHTVALGGNDLEDVHH